MSDPTHDQKTATLRIFKNIAQLLEHGLFFGHAGATIADSIGFLNANIVAIEKDLAPPPEPAALAVAEPLPRAAGGTADDGPT